MEAKTNFVSKNAPVALALAFVVGSLFGWLAIGWGVWPVAWTDAGPRDLAAGQQREYVILVADSYALNHDAALAKTRMGNLGDQAPAALQSAMESSQGADQLRLASLASAAGVGEAPAQPGGAEAAAPSLTSRVLRLAVPICGVAVLVVLAGGAAIFLWSRQSKAGAAGRPTPSRQRESAAGSPAPTVVAARSEARPGDAPIAQFMTTYVGGDDLYDDSFSIDGPTGDFLGECGVGISETIGVGDPKKIAALEVWLFDKNDIRTVTKVLMSDHTFNDGAVRSKLSAKGDPALARAGDTMVLETATLHVTARVVDLAYGAGPLPPNSYFDRITIELAAWQKEAQPAPAAQEA